ncbi:hypothetical protein HXS80_20580 [Streptomyces sp. CB04723]|uniref:hypothetical protein n=1 Tax=Streptomyces TaxID=1883 RepID=UPI0015C475AE|nr:hypothetical protein [Streptomyces sp. CB04723]QLG33800.1 hypothetical protein HXS80_20580 [Streptomyces sp. CB04723]
MTRPPLTVAELRATIAATLDTAPTTAASAMHASMMRAFVTLLDDTLAEHGETDDTLDNSGLLALAQGYARATTPEQRDQLAADIAARLTVDEAGVILRAAAAVRTAVPGIVLRAKANDTTTAKIARELDMTDSYVRRIAREHRLVSWRLDLYDSEAGPGWQPYEAGDDIIPATRTEPDLAEHILAAAGRGPREHRARVLIWDGTDEQPDTAAIYTHEGDSTGGHDWYHPTPLAGLVCRRCDLAHKNWSGDSCPADD